MKISQLHYFTTLAELQNMSRASELLHVSQSSLSKNISAIENELGISLFDRNGKHISLNKAGQRFLEACNHILSEYDSTLNDIREMTTGSGNRIKIGVCGNPGRMISCMAEFKKLHPETEYDVNSNIEGDDFVDINAFDVLIYPEDPKYSRFNGYSLYSERYWLAVPAGHPLYREAAVKSSSLKGQDMVFLRTGNNKEHAYYVCSALSVRLGSQNFVTSRTIHRDTIAAGLALGFVPESCKSLYMSTGNIHLIPIIDGSFTRYYNICFRRKKHLGMLAREFENYSIEYFKLAD